MQRFSEISTVKRGNLKILKKTHADKVDTLSVFIVDFKSQNTIDRIYQSIDFKASKDTLQKIEIYRFIKNLSITINLIVNR